jgi:anti-anti-sigma factor
MDTTWQQIASQLSIRVSRHDASVLVQVRGEMDIASASAFVDAVRPIVVDRSFGRALIGLEELDFLDLGGADSLGQLADALRGSGGRSLVLLNPSRLPRLVLDFAGLSQLVWSAGPEPSRAGTPVTTRPGSSLTGQSGSAA